LVIQNINLSSDIDNIATSLLQTKENNVPIPGTTDPKIINFKPKLIGENVTSHPSDYKLEVKPKADHNEEMRKRLRSTFPRNRPIHSHELSDMKDKTAKQLLKDQEPITYQERLSNI
jgi:hypothetical protein